MEYWDPEEALGEENEEKRWKAWTRGHFTHLSPWTEGWVDGGIDGWMMDGWLDGWVGGWS